MPGLLLFLCGFGPSGFEPRGCAISELLPVIINIFVGVIIATKIVSSLWSSWTFAAVVELSWFSSSE